MGASSHRYSLLLVEPSVVLRRGFLSVLGDLTVFSADITTTDSLEDLQRIIGEQRPDFVLINPIYLGHKAPAELFENTGSTKFVALGVLVQSTTLFAHYDAVVSVDNTTAQLDEIFSRMVQDNNTTLVDEELSPRERDIVVGIASGRTNKEIADTLCISTHTVMTHRKNIAAKLRIHNPAGLTIYAITNNLIDINDVK